MFKNLLILKNGLIAQTIITGDNTSIAEEMYLEYIIKFIDTDISDSELLGKYFYDLSTDTLKPLPTKPSQYHIWNLQTEQWEEPEGYLQTIRADGNKQTNQLASQKILSKYPIYKQLNLGRTSEAQVMYDWIDNIRNLSNIATASIEQAVTQEEITTIVDNFKAELANII